MIGQHLHGNNQVPRGTTISGTISADIDDEQRWKGLANGVTITVKNRAVQEVMRMKWVGC